MGDFVKWVGKSFGDFLDGLLGGVVDWIIDFIYTVGGKIGDVIDAVLSIFNNVPKIISDFNLILHGVFWFVPDSFFHTLYVGIAVIFLLVLYKFFRHVLGK